MAKFDKHGRPIPVRPDLPGPRGPIRPRPVHRREEARAARPVIGAERESFMDRLSEWKARLEGVTGPGEPKSKKVNLLSALFIGVIFIAQVGYQIVSRDEATDPEPAAGIETAPLVPMTPLIEAERIGAILADDAMRDDLLATRGFDVRGEVASIDTSSPARTLVVLDTGTADVAILELPGDVRPDLRGDTPKTFRCQEAQPIPEGLVMLGCALREPVTEPVADAPLNPPTIRLAPAD